MPVAAVEVVASLVFTAAVLCSHWQRVVVEVVARARQRTEPMPGLAVGRRERTVRRLAMAAVVAEARHPPEAQAELVEIIIMAKRAQV